MKNGDRQVVVGVLSYGPDVQCGNSSEHSFGVYSNVAHYLPFIQSHIYS
jgi:secreted trypsin-like serine protease